MLEASLVAACLIIYWETTVLLDLAQVVIRLRTRLASGPRTVMPVAALEKILPRIRAKILDSAQLATERDFLGRSAILLFVGKVEMRLRPPQVMTSIVARLCKMVEGRVHIVCRGDEDDCLRIKSDWQLDETDNIAIRVLLDPDNGIADSLGIISTPSAVLIDAEGRVAKYGAAMAWPGKSDSGFLIKSPESERG